MSKQIISVTEKAAARVQELIANRDKPTKGIKIGVRSGGCSGLAYTFEYADEIGKFDEVINEHGITIVVDPKATMYLIGTTLDYVDDKIKSGFVFINPNEKSRCGCGESFQA